MGRAFSIIAGGVGAGHRADPSTAVDHPDGIGIFICDVDISQEVAGGGVGLTQIDLGGQLPFILRLPFAAVVQHLAIEAADPFQIAEILQHGIGLRRRESLA